MTMDGALLKSSNEDEADRSSFYNILYISGYELKNGNPFINIYSSMR